MIELLRMAWRNLWRNWRRTVIAATAIMLGLVLILLMDGIIVGSFEAAFGNAVKLQGGNVLIHAPGYRDSAKRQPLYPLADAAAAVRAARAQPQVVAASRRINTSGMVSSHEGTFPITIIGVEPEQEVSVGLIPQNVSSGRYLAASDQDLLLIGKALAAKLEVTVGDRITLVGRAPHDQMRSRTMTVVGIYSLGLEEVENTMTYVSLAEAQALFDLRDQATEVVVTLQNVGQEQQVVAALRAALPGYETDSWLDLNPVMRQSVDRHRETLAMVGVIVLLVAGVGILNLMLMVVFERTREIGLLGAMGLKPREILALFLSEGVLIGLVGAVAGCALGGLIVGYLGQVGFEWGISSQVTEVTALLGPRIYPSLVPQQVLERGLTVGVIAALATLYPAWQAARREPAEALRFV